MTSWRPFDIDRPPVGNFRGRFGLLEKLVDYIFEGPSGYVANDTEAPTPYLTLEEALRPAGDREAYIINATQGEWAPSPDSPLIRHLIWHRHSDRSLTQHGCVLWPDIEAQVYRLPRDLTPMLDELGDQLARSFSQLESRAWVLGLKTLYETGPPESIRLSEGLNPGTPWRTVSFGGDRITYLGPSWQPAVDAAFGPIWDFCQQACISDRLFIYEEKYFPVTPAIYAAGLRHAMSLVDAN
jgi:hypothetical protein